MHLQQIQGVVLIGFFSAELHLAQLLDYTLSFTFVKDAAPLLKSFTDWLIIMCILIKF